MGKKSLFKSTIAVGLIIILLTGCGNANSQVQNEPSVNTENESDNNTQTELETESEIKNEIVTVADKYIEIGKNVDTTFVVPEKSIEFMNKHEEFFPGSDENDGAMSDFVNWEIGYPHLAKSISKYTDQLFVICGYVIDVWETEDEGLTYLHIVDYNGYNYTLYYLGALDEVFEETEVYVYAMPFSMVTFENMSAQYTEAVVGAACYVEVNLYD